MLFSCNSLPTFNLAYSQFDQFQSATDFQTPVIFDGSFECPVLGREDFDQFADGLLAKSGALLSMSAYEKPSQAGMIGILSRVLTKDFPASSRSANLSTRLSYHDGFA